MNRRNWFKSIGACIIGLMAAPLAVGKSMAALKAAGTVRLFGVSLWHDDKEVGRFATVSEAMDQAHVGMVIYVSSDHVEEVENIKRPTTIDCSIYRETIRQNIALARKSPAKNVALIQEMEAFI